VRTSIDLGVLTPLPFTIVGFALGVFLGFRNNTSYDRFWEGRRLWGELVNTCRTLTRDVLVLVDAATQVRPTARQRELVHATIAFVHTVRQHLRNEHEPAEYVELLPQDTRARIESARHRPVAVLDAIGQRVRQAWQAGAIDAYHVPVLVEDLQALTNELGGCERIRNTPIPTSYTTLTHRIVQIYVFGLPFGLVTTIGEFTPLVVAFTAYAFLGLDAIGDELENPFGTDPNDLPLAGLSRSIEINLKEMLDDPELPAPLEPVDRVLL
jgi:putative membrane protein